MSDDRPPRSSPRISALDQLPEAYFALASELDALGIAEETRADCSSCVMLPPGAGELEDGPWVFHPETRCCTFNPRLANFLAGRALSASDAAARQIRLRLRSGHGVDAMGIHPPDAWSVQYQRTRAHSFGRDIGLRCPYWAGGEHTCGIWAARPAPCRTWFCKHDEGHPGALLWAQVGMVLSRIATLLATYCVQHGSPPDPLVSETELSDAEIETWSTWYRECARMVDGLEGEPIAGMESDARLSELRAILAHLVERPRRTLPDVVVPALREIIQQPEGVRVAGYSIYDSLLAPRSLFHFLSRLDGTRTWRQAQDDMQASDGLAPIDDATVAELHRIGALESPGEPDHAVVERRPWPGPGADQSVARGASEPEDTSS